MDPGSPLADVERAPLRVGVGERFAGRYEVVGHLGRGGMGAVLDVIDMADGSRAALKIMHASLTGDVDLRARFMRESELLGALASPHLVRILHAGVDDESGAAFYVMERLEGEDLGARLKRGPIPWPEAREILGALAAALDETHRAGVVHRDLKPENLYLAAGSNGRLVLKVLDFGVAKVLADSGASLHSTRTLGSPLYMSPEQLEGEATLDGRSDVYAFGHVAYALLAGQAYWEEAFRKARGVFPVVMRVMRGAVDPPSARLVGTAVVLPAGFDAWFARATARDADDRFDTAGEAMAALASGPVPFEGSRSRSGGLAPAAPAEASEPRRAPSRRRQLARWVAGATLGASALALGMGARPDTTSRVTGAPSVEAAKPEREPRQASSSDDSGSAAPARAAGGRADVPSSAERALAASSGRTPAPPRGPGSKPRAASSSTPPAQMPTRSNPAAASSGAPAGSPRPYDPTDVR